MPTVFDTRFVGYVPGGAKITNPVVVTALTATLVIPYSDAPTISIPVSAAIYGQIPTFFEVALEYYNGTAWTEAPNCRFLINTSDSDDTDVTKTSTLTGVGIWHWFLNKTYLNHVAPYGTSSIVSVASYNATGITSAGTTLTKASHGFTNGDRVKVLNRGGSSGINTNAFYYVRNATTNTFQLSGSTVGAARTIGTHSGISLSVLPKQLTKSGHQFLNGQKVTVLATGGATGVTIKQDYFIVGVNGTRFSLAATVNGPPLSLGVVTGMSLTRTLNGDRRFNAKTPGFILKTLIDEAQARGELSPGAVPLTYDFTATVDSAGVAWPKTFTIGFPPGTTGLALLQILSDKGWIEYSMSGRTLRAYPAGHGTDRSTGTLPIAVGAAAESRPIKSTLDNMLTSIITVGESGKLLHVGTSTGSKPLGELGSYQTQSGVTDDGTSKDIVDRTILKTAGPDVQWTVSELAEAATSLPFKNYLPGDTVRVRIADAWTSLNVAQVQLRIDSAGRATIDTTLGYRFTGLLAKVARRNRMFFSGRDDSGNGTTVPSFDTIQPVPPPNPLSNTTAVYQAGRAKAAIAFSWDPVSVDADGNDVAVKDYEVWARADGAEDAIPVGRTGGALSLTVPAADAQTYYYLSVRALSASGEWGAFSDETEVATAAPTDVLDPPTAPTLTSRLGQLSAKWDGYLVDSLGASNLPPSQFAYVYPAYSTSPAGPFTALSTQVSVAGGAVPIPNLVTGTTYYVVFYAVDVLGVASAPSPVSSLTIVGVTGPDVVANSLTANTAAVGYLEALQISLGQQNPLGVPTNRVATPVTNTGWWAPVLAGTIPLYSLLPVGVTPSVLAASGSTGITLAPSSSVTACQYLTAVLPVPASRALHARTVASGAARASVMNLAQQGSAEASVSQWTGAFGTTGAGTAGQLVDPTAHGGNASYLMTWTTASTVTRGGIVYGAGTTGEPVTVGLSYAAGIWVMCSKAQVMTLEMTFQTAGGAAVSTVVGAPVLVPAGQWTRITVAGVAPATSATVLLFATSAAGTGSSVWAIGDTLQGDDVMIVQDVLANLPDIFDGDSQNGAWTGTKYASTSTRFASGVRVLNMDAAGTALSVSRPLPEALLWKFPNQVQKVTLTGAPTGGTFTLAVTADGQSLTTIPIAYNATAVAVQDAIEALTNVDPGAILASGVAGAWVLDVFMPVPTITATSSLTGGVTPGVTISVGVPAKYAAFIDQAANAGTRLFSDVQVFEAIGAGSTGGQSVNITPAGVNLTNDDGSVAISLGTNTDNVFSVSANTGLGFEPLATIDNTGAATFQTLAVNNSQSVRGTDLLGTFEDITRNGSSDTGSIFDRLARGVVIDRTFSVPNYTGVTTRFQAIASDVFQVKAGRRYMIVCDMGIPGGYALSKAGTTTYTLSGDVRLHTAALDSSVTAGVVIDTNFELSANNSGFSFGQFSKMFDVGVALDADTLVADTPIYFMIRVFKDNATAAMTWTGRSRTNIGRFSVVDVGPAIATTVDATDTSNSGATAHSSSRTDVFYTSTAKSWKNSGATLVTGTGQFTNANSLYQGFGASPMGSRFSFGSLALSGRTASRVQMFLQNSYTYSGSGVTAHLGASGGAIGATFGTRQNGWDVHFGKGEGKWIDIPSSLWPSIMSGAILNFSLGLSGSSADFSYFAGGTTASNRPRLKITSS